MPIRGTLQCFFDVVSPCSYIAFESLLQYEARLPVKINFRPVFNGVIMKNSNNAAPAAIKRKGEQMFRDVPMVADYWAIPYRNISNFNDRVMKKRSTPAMRFLTACKEHESEQTFRAAIRALFTRLYVADRDIFEEEDVRKLFDEKHFTNREHLYYLMNTDRIRESLVNTTNEALENGAYGVPWLTLKPDGKETIQLFGSDRLNIICHLLDVPFEGNLGGIVKLE